MNDTAQRYQAWRESIEPELAAKRPPPLADDEHGCFLRRHEPGVRRRKTHRAPKPHPTKWS